MAQLNHQTLWESLIETPEKQKISAEIVAERNQGIPGAGYFENILRLHALTGFGLTFFPTDPIPQETSADLHIDRGIYKEVHFPRTANTNSANGRIKELAGEAVVLEVAGPTSQYALFDLAAVPNHFVTISNQVHNTSLADLIL